jgi:hypothetical protein
LRLDVLQRRAPSPERSVHALGSSSLAENRKGQLMSSILGGFVLFTMRGEVFTECVLHVLMNSYGLYEDEYLDLELKEEEDIPTDDRPRSLVFKNHLAMDDYSKSLAKRATSLLLQCSYVFRLIDKCLSLLATKTTLGDILEAPDRLKGAANIQSLWQGSTEDPELVKQFSDRERIEQSKALEQIKYFKDQLRFWKNDLMEYKRILVKMATLSMKWRSLYPAGLSESQLQSSKLFDSLVRINLGQLEAVVARLRHSLRSLSTLPTDFERDIWKVRNTELKISGLNITSSSEKTMSNPSKLVSSLDSAFKVAEG